MVSHRRDSFVMVRHTRLHRVFFPCGGRTKVALSRTHNHQDHALHSFASSSPPADMGSKRYAASLDTADAGAEEELFVKMHKVHGLSWKCVMCCACHRGVNRSAHSLEDSKDTSRPCVQCYSKAVSYMDITEKLHKDGSAFLKASTTSRRLFAREGSCTSPWLRQRGVRNTFWYFFALPFLGHVGKPVFGILSNFVGEFVCATLLLFCSPQVRTVMIDSSLAHLFWQN